MNKWILFFIIVTFAACGNNKEVEQSETKDSSAITKQNGMQTQINTTQIKNPQNIMDYYLLLPADYFFCDASASDDNEAFRKKVLIHQNIKNGYLKAQPQEFYTLEVALFKNKKSNENIIAAFIQCGDGCMCNAMDFLVWNQTKNLWENISQQVFPSYDQISKKINGEESIKYVLPEFGTTIVGKHAETEKTLIEIKWNGERFVL